MTDEQDGLEFVNGERVRKAHLALDEVLSLYKDEAFRGCVGIRVRIESSRIGNIHAVLERDMTFDSVE